MNDNITFSFAIQAVNVTIVFAVIVILVALLQFVFNNNQKAFVKIECPKIEQSMKVNVKEIRDGLVVYTVECSK